MSVIRALDVGFGSTKFVVGHSPGGRIECRLFPSIAPMFSLIDIGDGILKQRDSVVVMSDGNHYEVGPDSELALGTHHTRVLHSDYTRTPEYLALARGALHYMNEPVIDLLVVGLPVAHLSSLSEELAQRMVGTHPLPGNRAVTVRRALAVAQPVGGLFDCVQDADVARRMRNQLNLIIDPGFFTLDWVVTKGVMPIVHQCGSFSGGISAILKRVAEGISKRHKIVYTNLNAIDEALRTGSLCLYGQDEPISNYLEKAVLAADDGLSALCNSVGAGHEIKNIFLVGGGARLFCPGIEKRFPHQQIHLVEQGVFANVRGFQIIGEDQWNRRKGQVA